MKTFNVSIFYNRDKSRKVFMVHANNDKNAKKEALKRFNVSFKKTERIPNITKYEVELVENNSGDEE